MFEAVKFSFSHSKNPSVQPPSKERQGPLLDVACRGPIGRVGGLLVGCKGKSREPRARPVQPQRCYFLNLMAYGPLNQVGGPESRVSQRVAKGTPLGDLFRMNTVG